jgi:hypothetical protein
LINLLIYTRIFFSVSSYWFQSKKSRNLRGNKVTAMYAPETGTEELEPSATTVGTSSVKITLVCKQCQNYIAADTEEV